MVRHVLDSVTSADLQSLLHREGLMAKVAKDDGNACIIESAISGLHFYIIAVGGAGSGHYTSLSWRARYRFEQGNRLRLLRKVNEWNRASYLGKASVMEDDLVRLEMNIPLRKITLAYLGQRFGEWVHTLERFSVEIFD